MRVIEYSKKLLQPCNTQRDVDAITLVPFPHLAEKSSGRLQEFDEQRLHREPAVAQHNHIGGCRFQVCAYHDVSKTADIFAFGCQSFDERSNSGRLREHYLVQVQQSWNNLARDDLREFGLAGCCIVPPVNGRCNEVSL